MEADKQLQQVINDGDSDVAQCLLEAAEQNLDDLVNECRESTKYVIRPIVF
jgi:hypothetical protein